MSSDAGIADTPTFFTILPIVTGEGEELFMPQLLRSLMDTGRCCFTNPRKIGQLRPRKSSTRLEMVGSGKPLTNRQEEIGLIARRYLAACQSHLVVLIDNLEKDADQIQDVFDLYRNALNLMLAPHSLEGRASVHFMVRMVEAYFFNDSSAVNSVRAIDLTDFDGDPETIIHPKGRLKKLCQDCMMAYDEKEHGQRIAKKIDLPKVLAQPSACRSMRSLVKWCSRMIGDADTERFQLLEGEVCQITGSQISD